MSRIEVLAQILSSREALVRGAAFAVPEKLKPLISAGIIVPTGHVSSVLCTECSDPHTAEVDSVGGDLGWYCPEVGFVTADPVDVAAFEVRADVLADRLRIAIEAKRLASPWPTSDPLAWSIGSFDVRGLAVAVCLAPDVGDIEVLAELGRYLDSPPGHPDGTAVLTNDRRRLEATQLPGGARIVYLGDVVALGDDGHISVDRETLARLTLPETLLHPSLRGRPADKRIQVRQILEELDQQGRLGNLTGRPLLREVLPELRKRMGKNTTLSRSTLLDASCSGP
jgi:hypothetical protein